MATWDLTKNPQWYDGSAIGHDIDGMMALDGDVSDGPGPRVQRGWYSFQPAFPGNGGVVPGPLMRPIWWGGSTPTADNDGLLAFSDYTSGQDEPVYSSSKFRYRLPGYDPSSNWRLRLTPQWYDGVSGGKDVDGQLVPHKSEESIGSSIRLFFKKSGHGSADGTSSVGVADYVRTRTDLPPTITGTSSVGTADYVRTRTDLPPAIAGVSVVSDALATLYRTTSPEAAIVFDAAAATTLLLDTVYPGAHREYFEGSDLLNPKETAEIALVGDDDLAVLNRLELIGSSQLVVDPGYTGTAYDLVALGFKKGDKLVLEQADGQPVGANDGSVVTLVNPSTFEIFESLVFPDSPAGVKYKFRVRRRT